jgi:hypothetical protein
VTDFRSLAKRWNNAARRHTASLRRTSPPRPWPFVGMFAIGLVAGAFGSYVVMERFQLKRFAIRALTGRQEGSGDFASIELASPGPVKSRRSNHRRKAALEVS